MKNLKIEVKNDGRETERFLNLAKRVISTPKEEIDRRLAAEKANKEREQKKVNS